MQEFLGEYFGGSYDAHHPPYDVPALIAQMGISFEATEVQDTRLREWWDLMTASGMCVSGYLTCVFRERGIITETERISHLAEITQLRAERLGRL